jgi:biotin carboxyl carrier protein
VQYQIEIGGRVRQVVVQRAAGAFVVTVDGRQWHVDAARVDGQTLSLLIADAGGASAAAGALASSYDATVVPAGLDGQLGVTIGTAALPAGLNTRRSSRRSADGNAAGGGPQRLVAPMPGKIVRLLAQPGDPVKARQAIVVMEAMKMENELRADRDGTVAEIRVREGQLVDAGVLLAVVQPGH